MKIAAILAEENYVLILFATKSAVNFFVTEVGIIKKSRPKLVVSSVGDDVIRAGRNSYRC